MDPENNYGYTPNSQMPPPPPEKHDRCHMPSRCGEMSMRDWLITLVTLLIPCVGIVMMFIWAFSDDNLTRRNFSRALIVIIVAVVTLVCAFGFLSYMGSCFNQNRHSMNQQFEQYRIEFFPFRGGR